MRILASVVAAVALLGTAGGSMAAKPDLSGVDLSRYGHYYETKAPTPVGTGHLGPLESGKTLQIRYELPKKRPITFNLDFHNIVAYAGGGKSYQLQIRRDSATGPLLYTGPILTSEPWNASNRKPLEITDKLRDADFARGWLDIFVTATVTGDSWTMYRDEAGTDHDLRCLAVDDSPGLRKAIAWEQLLRTKGITLSPMPQKLTPMVRDFVVSAKARILLPAGASEEDVFAAGLLRDEIAKLSGKMLPIRRGAKDARPEDLVFVKAPKAPQGYTLQTDGRFRVAAGDSDGLFYAVQTACQLLQKQNGKLVVLGASIADWPTLRYRMFQYDIARSQTINVPYVKRVIREMARFKLNQLMFYMEDDFKYSKYPFTGRPGTFTPEKARELVAYARKYHVELIPQLECLAHGTAMLSHPEFADIRENGSAWLFCTTNPRTWEVLDDMVGELTTVFNNTKFIHVGCDEFENGFAKCPSCKALADKIGWGGLYALHMTKLNDIAKKHGRELIFWPAHGSSDPEIQGALTLKYAEKLPKDMIPMEWIYHGPASYPTLEQFQKAGFSKLFAAPAVVGYSRLYPNYEVSFRGISGFYRAAAERHLMGGCACTWELLHGAQMETEWYGLIYSAHCSWNPYSAEEGRFDRAFAANWLGIADQKIGEQVPAVFQLAEAGDSPKWGDLPGIVTLFFADLNKTKQVAGGGWDAWVTEAPRFIATAQTTQTKLDSLMAKSSRNQVTLEATANILRVWRATVIKLLAVDQAGKLYTEALDESQPQAAMERIEKCIALLEGVRKEYSEIRVGFEKVRDERGGAPQDAERTARVEKSFADSIAKLNAAVAAYRLDSSRKPDLPKREEVGL